MGGSPSSDVDVRFTRNYAIGRGGRYAWPFLPSLGCATFFDIHVCRTYRPDVLPEPLLLRFVDLPVDDFCPRKWLRLA